MLRNYTGLLLVAAVALVFAASAEAACMNKFVARSDGNKKVVTLLTGMMTFQEAQDLAKSFAGKKIPVEWVDDKGKAVASAVEFQAVRPMPVACGDKASGSVVNATFITFATPSKAMTVKFTTDLTVTFEEQAK